MDISYLLFLQNLREGALSFLAVPMNLLSSFTTGGLMFLSFVLYWSVSKQAGQVTIVNFSTTYMGTIFIKNTCCINRPWIRDARVTPYPGALPGATGYSFPSGHSSTAASVYGTQAVRQWRKRRWFSVLCIVLLLLTMFSRNFLGVHTPQDVIVGMLTGLFFVLLGQTLLPWLLADERRLRVAAGIGIAVSVAFMFYIHYKPYPMDYDASGTLIVDPKEMEDSGFQAAGCMLGLIAGYFLERKYVRFTTDGISMKQRIGRILVCTALIAVFMLGIGGLLKAWNRYIGEMLQYFLTFFVVVYLGPLCFTKIERAGGGRQSGAKRS